MFFFSKYLLLKTPSPSVFVHISLSIRINLQNLFEKFIYFQSMVTYYYLQTYRLQGCLLEWFFLFTLPLAVYMLLQILTILNDKYFLPILQVKKCSAEKLYVLLRLTGVGAGFGTSVWLNLSLFLSPALLCYSPFLIISHKWAHACTHTHTCTHALQSLFPSPFFLLTVPVQDAVALGGGGSPPVATSL